MGFRVLANLIKYKILVYTISSKRYGKYSINIHSRYITDDFSVKPNSCCFDADEINKLVLEQYDTL